MKKAMKRCIWMLCIISMLAPLLCGVLPAPAEAATTTVAKEFPMPNSYFGSPTKTDIDTRSQGYYYSASTYPESKIEKYIAALEKVGLESDGGETLKGGNIVTLLEYNDEDCVYIGWRKNTKDMVVRIYLKGLNAFYSANKKPSTTTTSADDNSDPSILAIIENCFGKNGKTSYDEDNWKTTYTYSASSYPESNVKKFIDIMEDRGMKCYTHSFSSNGGSKEFHIYADVGSSLVSGKWKNATDTLTVTVDWEYIEKYGKFDADDIPDAPEPTPAPTGSSDKQCISCGGSGRCSDCGGSGTVRKWVSGTVRQYVTQNCTSCYSPGKCRSCGGDGRK